MNLDYGINLLQKMVGIPSVSGNEAALADMLEKECKSIGMKVERLGESVLASTGCNKPGLLFCGHIDTVLPAKGYSFDPHNSFIKDGNLYGLGSEDNKGGVAMVIAAMKQLYDEGFKFEKDVQLALVAGEELPKVEDKGVYSLLQKLKAEYAVVTESTKLKPSMGHRGRVCIKVKIKGIQYHASQIPHRRENAIYNLGKFLFDLRSQRFKRHPILGDTTCTPTVIHAGEQLNSTPLEAETVVDFRITPYYSQEDILDLVGQIIHSLRLDAQVEVLSSSEPVFTEEHPLFDFMNEEPITTMFHTDGEYIQRLAGIPMAVFGPGDEERAHKPDEFIPVKDVQKGVELTINFIRYYCRGK